MIYGDFNLQKIIWDSPDQTAGSDEIHLTELLNYYFLLYQVNKQPTRGENILDLVITTLPDQVKVETILPPQESGIITDHNCVVFNIRATVKAPVKLNRYVCDYQKANLEGLRSILQSFDFSNIIESNTDVNVPWSLWKEKYLTAIRDF